MNRSCRVRWLCVVAGMLLLSGAASAQNPVTWAVKTSSARVAAGGNVSVQLTAQIESGWHMYSLTQGAGGPIPTRITLPEGQPFKLGGAVRGPRPRTEMDPNFQMNTETYEGSAAFIVPVVTGADAPAGMQNIQVNVRFQACNSQLCLPPRTVKLAAPVEIAGGATAQQPAQSSPTPSPRVQPSASPKPSPTPRTAAGNAGTTPTPPESAQGDPSGVAPVTEGPAEGATQPGAVAPAAPGGEPRALDGQERNGSLWSFIWLAITFGALSLLTPCVFPMVPITVSYFTNHAAGSRSSAVRDAVIYAFGIILTFTALGVALAVLFGAAGINRFAANPYVNLLITAIFLGFAMSLFGAYNMQVPSSVLTKLDAVSRNKESSRIIGLLLMGLTFSLTSFTCTAPFVGTVLVRAAQGEWMFPIVGMLAFSTVFALPFFILALAPQLVAQLPKSGGWLNAVKVVMGLVEIAAAMKFLSNVDLVWRWGIFTREVVLASWVAVALLIAVYLLGKFQLSHDTPTERIGALRLMLALVSLAVCFYLLTGLFGRSLGDLESFLPPAAENSSAMVTSGRLVAMSRPGDGLSWITNDYQAALNEARAAKKPVFVDFTGYTCTNCRWMEANMFTRTPVRDELAKYVRVRLYTDGEGQPFEGFQQMQQDRFGTVALPLYAVLNSDGQPLTTFPGLTRDEGEFVSFLRNGEARFVPMTAAVQRRATSR